VQTITITQDDDGLLTVDVARDGAPAGEPYQCESPAECLAYVRDELGADAAPADEEAPQAPADEPVEDFAQAWDEEAAKRPIQG
jgi:hypothetical protein